MTPEERHRQIWATYRPPIITSEQLGEIFADWKAPDGVKLQLVQAWKKGHFSTKANWWPAELDTLWAWIGRDGFHERHVAVQDHIRAFLLLGDKFDDWFVIGMPMLERAFVDMFPEVRKQWFHSELGAAVERRPRLCARSPRLPVLEPVAQHPPHDLLRPLGQISFFYDFNELFESAIKLSSPSDVSAFGEQAAAVVEQPEDHRGPIRRGPCADPWQPKRGPHVVGRHAP